MTLVCDSLDVIQTQHFTNDELFFPYECDSYECNLNQLCEIGEIDESEIDERLIDYFGW